MKWVRRVQITGGSTFMTTLPKEWAEEMKLKAGSPIELIPQPPNYLVLKLQGAKAPKKGVIELQDQDKTGDVLIREIISMYISGFEIIEIKGERITSEQRNTVRNTVQKILMGLEIMEESADKIVIHYLLDPAKLSAQNILRQIHQNAKSMFQDAISALGTRSLDTAKDVVGRDMELDRLFLVLARQFRIVLRDILAEEQMGVGRVELFDYYTAARQLERIADHAVKIAEVISSLEKEVPKKVVEAIGQASTIAVEIVDGAMKALHETGFELANQALSKSALVDDLLQKVDEMLHRLDPTSAQLLGIVTDSIGRVKDYGVNIAETALNAAAPAP